MNFRFLPLITGMFVAVLVISNTLDTKVFQFFGLNLPAGIILFPLGYVFGDILTEVYGYASSRKVIWTGFFALLLMVASYEIGRLLPAASFWANQSAFDAIFSHVPRIVLASIAAFMCGEFCNSYVVAKMKVFMNGKHMWLRMVASTVVGQLVDTAVFVAIAFSGVFPATELLFIVLSAWAFKVSWEIIALPLTVIIVKRLKRAENIDFYDENTNFNPFSISK
jgi:queuosine precursor transporter